MKQSGGGDLGAMMQNNNNIPPELREAFRLAQVAKDTGDLKAQERSNMLIRQAIDNGGPVIKERFEQTMAEMSKDPTLQKKFADQGMTLPSGMEFLNGGPTDDLKMKLEAQVSGTQAAMAGLQKQQEELEKMSLLGDGASQDQITGFFKSQGWTDEQVNRALTDPAYGQTLMEETVAKMTAGPEKMFADMDSMFKQVDETAEKLNEITGKSSEKVAPLEKVGPALTSAQKAAVIAQKAQVKVADPKKEAEQIAKSLPPKAEVALDNAKKAMAMQAEEQELNPSKKGQELAPEQGMQIESLDSEVVVTVRLPKIVKSMKEVELEVGGRTIRIRPTDGKGFKKMSAELPEKANPEVDSAKFSKKRSEITIRFGIVSDLD